MGVLDREERGKTHKTGLKEGGVIKMSTTVLHSRAAPSLNTYVNCISLLSLINLLALGGGRTAAPVVSMDLCMETKTSKISNATRPMSRGSNTFFPSPAILNLDTGVEAGVVVRLEDFVGVLGTSFFSSTKSERRSKCS